MRDIVLKNSAVFCAINHMALFVQSTSEKNIIENEMLLNMKILLFFIQYTLFSLFKKKFFNNESLFF